MPKRANLHRRASSEQSRSGATKHPVTPDGRYFVVRGRLWRMSNPDLPEALRQHWVDQLMAARRDVHTAQQACDGEALRMARAAVDQAKHALGERGRVWWDDGAPDYNRYLVKNTPYASMPGLAAAIAPDKNLSNDS